VLVLMVAGHVYHPAVLILVPILAFVLLGLLDLDALVIRLALLEYSRLGRSRLKPDDPRDLASAAEMLADAENDAISPIRRVGLLASLGRDTEAHALLSRSSAGDPIEAAYAERLRIALAEQPDVVDRGRFEAAIRELEPSEARWQRLALATNLVHLDVRAGRPWKDRYRAAVAGLGPWDPGARGWLLVGVAQWFGAVPFAIILGILALVGAMTLFLVH
jgi:hypothetical protein